MFFLHLEAKGYSDNVQQVYEAVRVNWPLLKRGQAIRNALDQELPHISKELLYLSRIPEMTMEEIEMHKARLRVVYEENKDDLDAFWQRHPDWFEREGG